MPYCNQKIEKKGSRETLGDCKTYIKKRISYYYLLKQNKVSLNRYKTYKSFVTSELKISKNLI